jgi:large subunit ribosomal protein L15
MDLSTLKYADGSRKDKKRIGRGGARGGTSGKGHNGQRSRSGSKRRLWFEGGQMPLLRRLPKRGFTNFNRKEIQVVNLRDLEALKVEDITPAVLKEHGLIRKVDVPVKVLGDGEIGAKLTITANAFSKSAVEKIESAGGRATTL